MDDEDIFVFKVQVYLPRGWSFILCFWQPHPVGQWRIWINLSDLHTSWWVCIKANTKVQPGDKQLVKKPLRPFKTESVIGNQWYCQAMFTQLVMPDEPVLSANSGNHSRLKDGYIWPWLHHGYTVPESPPSASSSSSAAACKSNQGEAVCSRGRVLILRSAIQMQWSVLQCICKQLRCRKDA